MTKPSFFDQEKLVKDLWNEITTTGFSNRSKNDFYDFVLYLLNKYDSNLFLYANDNEENERLLKTKASRIKAAKKNISVQFMDKSEYDNIFVEFIKKISTGNLLSLNDDGKSYTMTIEDSALRSVLEAKLKRITNTTLDYKFNTETVTINHEAFLKMLAYELDLSEADNATAGMATLISETIDSLEENKNMQDLKLALKEVAGELKNSNSLQSLGINGLKAIATFASKKLLQ